MKIIRLFCLATQLQLINALNIINTKQIEKNNTFCLLIGRINNERTLSKLASLDLFEKIFQANPNKPYLKDWIRNPHFRKNYSFSETILETLSTNKKETFKRIIQNKHGSLINIIAKCNEIYFHNDILILKILFSFAPKDCQYHLIDEGIRSYLTQSIAWHHDYIHLYEPDLIDFTPKNSKIIPIEKISPNRKTFLSWIKFLYPPEPLDKSNIFFFDQPIGRKPRPFLSKFLKHYRIGNKEYAARINIIRNIHNNHINEQICIRKHPAEWQKIENDLPTNCFTFSSKTQTPFEIDLLFSSNTPKIFYTIYSTAACYWRLLFSNSIADHLNIKTYILLPQYLSYNIGDENKNLFNFFKKLAYKYPNNFKME